MEEKIAERMNFYDILAMVFPGGIWLLCIITILEHTIGWNVYDWLWIKTLHNVGSETCVGLCVGLLVFVLAYIIGLLSDSIIHYIRKCAREKKRDVISQIAKCMVSRISDEDQKEDKDKAQDAKLLNQLIETPKEYYTIRKQSMKNDERSTILTIEYQCAMIKGLLLPLSILTGLCFGEWSWWCLLSLSTFVLLCGLLYMRTHRLLETILRHYIN